MLVRKFNMFSTRANNRNVMQTSEFNEQHFVLELKRINGHLTAHVKKTPVKTPNPYVSATMTLIEKTINFTEDDYIDTQTLIIMSGDWPGILNTAGNATSELANFVPSMGHQYREGFFYDIPFPSPSHRWYSKFSKKREETLEMARTWDEKVDTIFWRGGFLGCAGCGELGKFFFPFNHYELQDCVDTQPRKGHLKERGYTYGPERNHFKEHERYRLVDLAQHTPVCGGVPIDAKLTGVCCGIEREIPPSHYGPKFPFASFAQYKYQIHIGNNGFADSLWSKLAFGSVVLK
eukprot:3933402-Rhodomonas_salina.1